MRIILFLLSASCCFADQAYLIYTDRPTIDATLFDHVAKPPSLDDWKAYIWAYDEKKGALYSMCGGNLEVGMLDYYDLSYKNAFYFYLPKEDTKYYCDLTDRLVVETGHILDGCDAPETWYYKVPI